MREVRAAFRRTFIGALVLAALVLAGWLSFVVLLAGGAGVQYVIWLVPQWAHPFWVRFVQTPFWDGLESVFAVAMLFLIVIWGLGAIVTSIIVVTMRIQALLEGEE